MLLDLNAIRLIALLVIALAYALFDLFNKREVPNVFVYACLVVALLLCISYWNILTAVGILIAVVVAAPGYVLYKRGLLGAGDVFELVTITLILPIQPAPFLATVLQLTLPFILSVFIAAGYFAIVVTVLYYLIFAKRSPLEKAFRIDNGKLVKATIIVALYVVLIALMHFLIGITLVGALLLLLLGASSFVMLVYERLINYRMVSLLQPRQLTRDDMIATNLMSHADIAYFKKKSKSFGRLATQGLIKDLRNEKKKLPVYRNAVPLAAFFFIGVLFSLLFGNLILLFI